MNVLLLHPDAEVRKVLAFALESKLDVSTCLAESGATGRAVADANKFVPDVVVAENTAEIKNYFLHATPPRATGYVLCESAETAPPAKEANLNFLGYALKNDLGANLLRLLEPHARAVAKPAEEAPFIRISTELLLRINPLAADVYVRLSSYKHVKLFRKDDTFNEEDLARYRDRKKLDYLYLQQADCGIFSAALLQEVNKIVAASKAGDPRHINAVGTVVETVHELIERVGVTEEVQAAVKGCIGATMKAMGDYPDLAAIMKMINDPNGKYIGRHTMLLTNISCALAAAMDWYSDATFEKLTMASFMHDASLTDQELCAVKNMGEFEKLYKDKFSSGQIQSYRGHPERAVMLLGHFKEVPAEVDKIIAAHHEHPMGSGFPAGLTSNYISPLASLFIVAHDLTDFILDHPQDFNVDDFLREFEKKYNSGHFKKIAKVMAEVEIFPKA